MGSRLCEVAMHDISQFIGMSFKQVLKIAVEADGPDEPVAAFSKLDLLIREAADQLAHCLRTHSSLKDVEALLTSMWQDLCDAENPEDEAVAFILRPFTSTVNLLLHLIMSDPDHSMTDEARAIEKDPILMSILSHIQEDNSPKSKRSIYNAFDFSMDEMVALLDRLREASLITISRFGTTIMYEISPTGKKFLAHTKVRVLAAHSL